MISPTIFFNLVISVIGALSVFSVAYIGTQGGPAYATYFYVYHLYISAFQFNLMGYASALAWIFLVIVLALTWLQFTAQKRWVFYAGDERDAGGKDGRSGRESPARRADDAAARIRRPASETALVFYVLAAVLTIFFFGPFFWTVSSSLKVASEITTFPPCSGCRGPVELLPRLDEGAVLHDGARIVPDSGHDLLLTVPTFGGFYVNSLIVTGLAVLGQVLSATLVAYGFARFQFPFRNTLFMLVIATLIVPWEVTIIPSFLLFKWLGWLDTLVPLIVPSWFGGAPSTSSCCASSS